MRINQFFLSFIMIFFAGLTAAQQPLANEWCGYRGKSDWLKWYQTHKHEIVQERGVDTSWLYVPVTIHLVGTDAGDGYFSIEKSIRAMCEMNEKFADARIRFYLMPGDAFRYINNSEWYDHQYNEGKSMIEENKIDGRLNAFVVSDPAGNCGYAWKDAIVLGKNCSGAGNITWAHETGHHLSLPHSFSGWEGFDWNYTEPAPAEIDDHQVEKADSSNCHNAGDGFCDTRPDYLNYRWQCNNNKESTVVQHDPNGIDFRSDATLIMGYANDNCSSRFTQEQIDAMRADLNIKHDEYIAQPAPFTDIADDLTVGLVSPVDSQVVQYNNVMFTWDLIPGATYYVVEISPNAGFAPVVYSKTFTPSTNSVSVTKNILNNWTMYWRVRAYNEWDLCQPYDNAQVGVFKTKNLTATNELEQKIAAELSPNPVAGGFPAILTVTSDETMDAGILITDATGRACFNRQVRLFAGENRVEIPTENLSAGFYVVNLHNEKGAFLKRLIVTE